MAYFEGLASRGDILCTWNPGQAAWAVPLLKDNSTAMSQDTIAYSSVTATLATFAVKECV